MSFGMRRIILPVLFATPLFLVTAAAAPTGDTPPEITITARDFSFDAPARMPAGAVTIRFENLGQEFHHAQLVRLEDGKTLDDLRAAEAAGQPADFAVWVGGPGVVPPGGKTVVTLDLEPGAHYWLCFVETSGQPHLAMGMVHAVTVEGGDGEPLPPADRTVVMDDYSFAFDQPLTAGRQVIRVENRAAQPHEMIMVQLAPGKTVDDVLAFISGGEEGDPPGRPVGGMQALTKGQVANFEVYLDPGRYGLICFIPDASDGQPHFVHGMMDHITVE